MVTGLETLALLKLFRHGHETTGGARLPFDDVARSIRKLDVVLDKRGLSVPAEDGLTDAVRAWFMGDTVDAVMLHSASTGLDQVSALADLKKTYGDVPIIAVLESRIDALLEAEGVDPGEFVD